MFMIFGVLFIIAVGFSLLLAACILVWCVYLLATKRQRRAFVILGAGFIGGAGLALLYFLLMRWFSDSAPLFIAQPTFISFGVGFAWAGFGTAAIAQLAPLFAQLFGQSNRWSARRAKN